MKQQQVLFIYSNGRVAAINKNSGDILWEVKLKDHVKSSFAHAVGSIQCEGDKLYIGVSGILVCLKTKDGTLVWKNELKGWGYNFVCLANVGNDAQAGSIQASAAANTAIIASTAAAT